MHKKSTRKLSPETLEARRCLAAAIFVDDPSSFVDEIPAIVQRVHRHNHTNPTDVNRDGRRTPGDALAVINELNRGAASGEAGSTNLLLCDTNDDGSVTPADALKVINALNAPASSSASSNSASNSLVPDDVATPDESDVSDDNVSDSIDDSMDDVVLDPADDSNSDDGSEDVVPDPTDDSNSDDDVGSDDTTDEDDSTNDDSTTDDDEDCNGRGGRRGSLFDRADANDDGVVTASEVPELIWDRLSDADADASGGVTKDELDAYRASVLETETPKIDRGIHRVTEALFNRADDNDDGILTEDEVPDILWDHLVGADSDASGGLTLAEIEAHRDSAKDRVFAEIDDNSDGLLTSDEVPEFVWKRLSKADADASGSVSLDELKTFHESHHKLPGIAHEIVHDIVNRVSGILQQVHSRLGGRGRR